MGQERPSRDEGELGTADSKIPPRTKARATRTVNVARAWRMEAKTNYDTTRLGTIACREAMQNAIDAVQGWD